MMIPDSTMRAAVLTGPGRIEMHEILRPFPKIDEALIRVESCGVSKWLKGQTPQKVRIQAALAKCPGYAGRDLRSMEFTYFLRDSGISSEFLLANGPARFSSDTGS
jgi:hypothetical protein